MSRKFLQFYLFHLLFTISTAQNCTLKILNNYQVFEPFQFKNGMIDENTGEWKYCFISRLNNCISWCNLNLERGCIGVSTHEGQSSLVFPVSSIESREGVVGGRIWYYPCLVGGVVYVEGNATTEGPTNQNFQITASNANEMTTKSTAEQESSTMIQNSTIKNSAKILKFENIIFSLILLTSQCH